MVVGLVLIVLFISIGRFQKGISLTCILEFPLVVGFALFFIFLLLSSYNFFGVYLAIEGLSLTLYTMAAMLHSNVVSIEAAIKYYVLGAVSSGIMLFGISLLFGVVGSLDFLEIQIFLGSSEVFNSILEVRVSLLCILFGFFFKISAFPCHLWVADVYEGVFTPVTAFFSIVVKISLLLFFVRIIYTVMFSFLFELQNILVFAALGSMVIGTLGALKQVRVKRFIAYTSINQVGFILLGVSCCNLAGLIASILYMVLYSIMSISFFTIVLNIEHAITKRGIVYLSDVYSLALYNAESTRHLVIVILSMAGLPPLGGFFGKLFIYFAVMEARMDWVVFCSLLIGVISTYYYLSLLRHVWFEKTRYIKIFLLEHNSSLNLVLRSVSIILCFFIVFFIKSFHVVTTIALSCMCPFSWY